MNGRRFASCVAGLTLAAMHAAPAAGQTGGLAAALAELELGGLLDLSYMHPDGPDTWADGGLAKLSYGNGQSNSNLFNLNQAALSVRGRLNWDWSASLTAKYSERQNNPIDISEALLLFRPVSTSPWRFASRLGAFMPPISFENTGVAWTSPYTLSYSAINSWVGEELKVFGGESQLGYQWRNGDRLGGFAAVFCNNDTAGALLAWRGWSLDNYVATLGDSYALPLATGLGDIFPKQAANTVPFAEVDGRPGFYAGISGERQETLKLRAMYYDNLGNTSQVRNGQYAWHTRFGSLGFKLELPWQTELIGQSMLGQTLMGAPVGSLYPIDTSFWAGSLLLSKKIADHRLSIRFDGFGASDHDLLPQDPHRENGTAWTVNYNYTFYGRHQINLEMSSIDSDRLSRLKIDQAAQQTQTLWQVAYRLFF